MVAGPDSGTWSCLTGQRDCVLLRIIPVPGVDSTDIGIKAGHYMIKVMLLRKRASAARPRFCVFTTLYGDNHGFCYRGNGVAEERGEKE